MSAHDWGCECGPCNWAVPPLANCGAVLPVGSEGKSIMHWCELRDGHGHPLCYSSSGKQWRGQRWLVRQAWRLSAWLDKWKGGAE